MPLYKPWLRGAAKEGFAAKEGGAAGGPLLAKELEAVGEEIASEKSVPAPAGSLAGLERDGEGSGEGGEAA